MADQTGYNQGVASVTPDATPPHDYQQISSSPDSFGAQIAQGEEKLGAGATKASTFFGQVVADDASNNFQDYATKLLHGDPNKTVPGPDGQPMPDTGYMGLRGRAALDARPDVSRQLDDKLKELRGNLQSPEQQLQFDNFSRRYRSMVDERVGSHADGQATTWYTGVNTATAKLALDHISNNYDNPNELGHGLEDLKHSYANNAILQGARPADPATGFPGDAQYQEAIQSAQRDGLKAQLDAMAVKDPARAQAILDRPDNKAIAGQYYDNMSASYRGRAKQQQGYGVSDAYIQKSYTQNPAINPVVLTNAGAQYGISASYLAHTQTMETGHNPNQTSSTGAKGPFQFIDSTARQVGLKDPFNYAESADRAAYLASVNKVSLTASMGRPPSDPELYLAHNQGADGAAALLAHPNQRAGDLVGDRAILVNGGDPNAPAIAFTSMMTQKYNGAPVAATQSRKAEVVGAILADPNLDPDVREHAIRHAEQTFAAQAIAEERDAKAKHESQEALQGKMVATIMRGAGPEIIADIATAADNGQLTPPQATELYGFVTTKGGVEDPLSYGTGYTDTMKRIMAPADDPSKITDVTDIVKLRNDGALTRKGAGELISTMQLIRKQPDQAGVTMVKSHQLDYYKSKMAIDDEMSAITGKPYKNQKGLEHFSHDFVPAFESAYSQWVAAGKDPMEFLNDPKKMDAIMDRVYPPAQRAMDSISAQGGVKPDLTVPPAPEGVEAKAWGGLMSAPPHKADGTPWEPKQWAGAVSMLRDHPTPEYIAAFNQKFAPSGYTAEDILKKAPPKGYVAPGTQPEPAKPAAGGPSLLQKAADNVLHYGKTGHAPGTGYEGEEAVPGESHQPKSENLAAADAEMNLTPQEKSLYERHLTNLNGPGGVDNPDGSRSTLFQTTVEHDGKFYTIPTVYDGKILWDKNAPDHAAAAVEKARQIGWGKFPSYKTEDEAEARYQQMHKFMEKDTSAYLARKQDENDPLKRLVRDNAIKPGEEQRSEARSNAVVGGIRG